MRSLELHLEEPSMVEIITIGLDIAKNVFQVHVVDAAGQVAVRRQLRRAEVVKFFAGLPPGLVGKSWLACALGHKACRDDRSVLYQRLPKLFGDLALARGDGRYARLVRVLGNVQLLILDDWGLEPLDAQARHDFLEILEDRYGRRSTIITSQLPVENWHAVIGNPTYADAILDRLVHNAQRLNLSGDSLRRTREKPLQKS
jgi:DNA replication protein DnaC